MKRAFLLHALVLVAASMPAGADDSKPGLRVGEELPGTFEPVNVNGPDAGRKTCIFCEYGESPVALVFARSVSTPLTQLTRRLDAASEQHKAKGLASSVVWLTDDPAALTKELKQLADMERLQHTLLRTYKADGPKGYDLPKDADVIVVLFLDRVIKATHTFKKGALTDKNIDAVMADLVKVLPAK